MRTVAIIQARTGSKRLPSKVLLNIAGMSMLERVIMRTRQATLVDDVIVATTTNGRDDHIVTLCNLRGVPCYRGSEEDVLSRYRGAAILFEADIIVRITGDCPFIDPTIIDKVILDREINGADYASNTMGKTYPDGLDVEVFTYNALGVTCMNAVEAYQRSHVTAYIYEHPERFRLYSSKCPSGDWSNHRWTVDTREDLTFAREVYKRCGDLAPWHSVLGLVLTHKGLQEINSHIQPKELHEG